MTHTAKGTLAELIQGIEQHGVPSKIAVQVRLTAIFEQMVHETTERHARAAEGAESAYALRRKAEDDKAFEEEEKEKERVRAPAAPVSAVRLRVCELLEEIERTEEAFDFERLHAELSGIFGCACMDWMGRR